jgi:tRNA A-37 threonylcarbamoyl transferase component Bud32
MDLPEQLRTRIADRYEIRDIIARGGMATVYVAYDSRQDRAVAIKVLDPELSVALGPERFLREIRIVSHLQHPHIVPVFDSGDADGLLYYVMPFVEGESLRDRLVRDGPLPLNDVVELVTELAGALDYAHGRGVIHRDVKPGNVLLSSGQALLADFGVARAMRDAGSITGTEVGVAIGTPNYMSPEQAAGHGHIDARTDVYALGCVVYEMLVGEPPFTGVDPQMIVARLLSEDPPSLRVVRPGVPAAVERTVCRALEKSPADRYQTAGDFAAALIDASRGAGRTIARPTARLAILGAIVLVAVVGVVLRLWPTNEQVVGELRVAVQPFGMTADRDGGATSRTVESYLSLFPSVAVMDATSLGQRSATSSVPSATTLREARELGAEHVVTVVVGDSGVPRATTLSMYDARDRSRIYHGLSNAGEGPGAALARLTLGALAAVAERYDLDLGVRRDALAATTSVEAVSHLVEARVRLLRGDPAAAADLLSRAIAADPGFLLAYHRRALVQEWRHRYGAVQIVDEGLRQAAGQQSRWVDLLRAQRHYALVHPDSAIRAFNLIRLDRPDDVDAWLGYAESLFHFGAFAGNGTAAARGALERVDALGEGYPTIHHHLFALAMQRQDSLAAADYLARLGPDEELYQAYRAWYLLEHGSASARARQLDSLRSANRAAISELVVQYARSPSRRALADTLASLLLAAERTPEDRLRGGQYLLALRAAAGRWDDAVSAWRAVADPGEFDAWMVQADLAGFPASRYSDPMYARARGDLDAGRIPDFTLDPYDPRRQAFQALVHRAAIGGDSIQVDALRRRLRAARGSSRAGDPLPETLLAVLEGRLALLAADTARAIARFEAAASRPVWHLLSYYPLISFAPERMLLVDLITRRGEPERAERWRRSFVESGSIGDALYARHLEGNRP